LIICALCFPGLILFQEKKALKNKDFVPGDFRTKIKYQEQETLKQDAVAPSLPHQHNHQRKDGKDLGIVPTLGGHSRSPFLFAWNASQTVILLCAEVGSGDVLSNW